MLKDLVEVKCRDCGHTVKVDASCPPVKCSVCGRGNLEKTPVLLTRPARPAGGPANRTEKRGGKKKAAR